MVRVLERDVGRRLYLVLQSQQDLQESAGGDSLAGDANAGGSQGFDGLLRVQQNTPGFPYGRDAKSRQEPAMVCQVETVNQWHRSSVDLALGDGSSQGPGPQVVQRHAAALHLEVEGLTAQVRNATHFHVLFLFPKEGEGL